MGTRKGEKTHLREVPQQLVPFCRFFFGWEIDYGTKVGALILTSPVEDLGGEA